MKKIISSLIIVLFVSSMAFAANDKGGKNESGNANVSITLSGVILDEQTNEELPGASISVIGTDINVTTDLDGKFEIKDMKPGKYSLKVSYIAYKDKEIRDMEIAAPKEKVEIGIESL